MSGQDRPGHTIDLKAICFCLNEERMLSVLRRAHAGSRFGTKCRHPRMNRGKTVQHWAGKELTRAMAAGDMLQDMPQHVTL